MYPKLLIPIDGSRCARAAVEQGIAYAQLWHAEVTLLHMVADSMPYAYGFTYASSQASDLLAELRREGESVLAEAAGWARAAGLACQTKLLETSQPASSLCELSAEYDMVVMMTHQRQGLESLVVGSMTEDALRCAQVPHLVLRCPDADAAQPSVAINRIAIALDASICSDAALNEGCKLAAAMGAAVTLIHIFEAPLFAYAGPDSMPYPAQVIEESRQAAAKALDHAASKAKAHGVEVTQYLGEATDTRVHQAIIEAAQGHDMLLMATHGRRGFDKLLLGSVTERVLRHSSLPLLVCHCTARA